TAEQVQSLEALGLTVFLVPNPDSFEDLYGIIEQVGVLVGRQQEAQALTAELADRVQVVEERVRGAELVKVYYEIDATDPSAPYTVGSGTFGDMLIGEAGGENVAGSLEGWVQLNLEELVAQDPQVMFFAAGPFIPTTIESVAERPGWGAISAVANGAIYPIDSDLIDLPGPRLVDGLELLARAIHPEAFE
ncbi:MAG: ABC transporter substrate-binding protein, partial [Anaerolineales bacterium]